MGIPLLGIGALAKGLGIRKAGAAFAKASANRAGQAGVTQNIVANAVPDVMMGTVYGLMSPGDLGDKLITGTTSSIGGLGGSMALRTALGPMAMRPAIGMGAELMGGLGGDMLSQPVADSLMRLKSPDNMTPYERMYKEQNEQMQALVEQDLLKRLRDQGLLQPSIDNRMMNPFNYNNYG